QVLQDLQQAWRRTFPGWVAGGDCSWASNLMCDAQGMVTRINLYNALLTGSIAGSISALDRLTYLDLSHNRLIGSIPSIIGMSRLNFLNLSSNNLTGSIPSTIGNMISLTYL
ncbi:unnamed protein product, partial [Closterium sp. NIES-54]